MSPKRRGRPKKMNRKVGHIAVNRVQKKMRQQGEVKLDGLRDGNRRITLANKKEYKSFSIIK